MKGGKYHAEVGFGANPYMVLGDLWVKQPERQSSESLRVFKG